MHHPYWYHGHRCGRGTSRLFWFLLGGATATWWYTHHDVHAWQERRACWRDRIPQDAYPAPGAVPPPPLATNQQAPGAQTQPQQDHRWERWGWGSWGREQHQQQQQQQETQSPRDRWGWGSWGRDARAQQQPQHTQPQQQPQDAPASVPNTVPVQPQAPPQSPPRWGGPWEREGAWGSPGPLPGGMEKMGREEKDIVQQATDTITELSEATLNNLLITIESLKSKLAEHRAQREQQERELQALREAKFKQFEEWQRHVQEQQAREEQKKDEPARRLV
ncbi:hypothetical protein FKP32DRAFT_1685529 [Trametes sanguinea]|nr:hypothetical protein FKP32DRAFT_1685529 [Trametes sanguinea]